MTARWIGGRRVWGVVLVLVSASALSAGGALAAARAVTILEAGLGGAAVGRLEVRTSPAPPVWQDLWAGSTAHWVISAALADAESSSLALEVRSGGALVLDGGMTAEIRSCTAPFIPAIRPADPPSCAGRLATVLPTQRLADVSDETSGPRVTLARLHPGSPRYLLVTLGIPAGTPHAELERRSGRVGVGLFSAGESEDPEEPRGPDSDDPDLSRTGSDMSAVALLAAGMVGVLGGSLLLRRGGRARCRDHGAASDQAPTGGPG